MRRRQFIVSASGGEGHSIRCGTYVAPGPHSAIEMARREKSRWAAEQLDVAEEDLMWEVEEDFL
jgi:hypothetical protein